MSFETWTSGELAALVRALHEARFALEPSDPLVWQSPVVIDMHVAAMEEADRRRSERGRPRSSAQADAWLLWRNRPERETVLRNLKRDDSLRQRCLGEGAPFLRALLRPFVLDDADVEMLMREIVSP